MPTPQKAIPRYLFILPNLLTLGSLFAGFYAIILLTSADVTMRVLYASFALLIATIFDLLDGRVARLTHTQSEFGLHMDSLVDLVSFGIAPALLIYKWSLHEFGLIGMIAAFVFAGCGACRLARFNVIELQQKHDEDLITSSASRYFVGLPIPLAAGMLIAVVIFVESTSYPFAAPSGAMGLTLILSFLMISNFRFRTFKDLKISPIIGTLSTMLVGILLLSAILFGYAAALVMFFAGYIIANLLIEIASYFYRRIKTLGTAYK
jgi:CDP-diacylglycerol--serine O-phosphatidyltransferase